ncbi:hypothetical protein JY651_44215 [Pyxidicoccus parkwayensis]|uniref:Uncharacterized protein n=1 Tax=Pyxidicoccus parkwayensis TaxID=2813578 RepID=A0ABX7NX73_9BACT|nr:hypothetical protein [Pyxidicoccus parkwaysis]QSQ22072.1 hypothetical protein JY651_44215 [Pyxidicoccus parkwaysis]
MAEWIPKLNPSVDLRKLALSAEEGFVLSRLDGATPARNLPALTGLPVERLRTILSRLVSEGALLPAAVASPGGAPAQAPATAPARAPMGGGPAVTTAQMSAQHPANTAASTPPHDASPLYAGAASPAQDASSLHVGATSPTQGRSPLLGHASPAHGTVRPPSSSPDEPNENLPTLDLTTQEAESPSEADASDEPEPEPAEEESEIALGNYRQLFETRLHPLPEDQRVAHAHSAEDPVLSALCFDPVPAVIKAVLENARTGLAHARLVARYHRNPVGLEALCARAAFAADAGVRRWLVRNPQLPSGLFRRLWGSRRLMELHKVTNDRDIPEGTRRSAREVLRQRFASGPAEEKVELIINTEGRSLAALIGMPVDGKTASLLCGRTYRSPMLIQNIARWSAAPPPLIAHLLRQEAVRRQPQLRMLLIRHPNAPADAKRGT